MSVWCKDLKKTSSIISFRINPFFKNGFHQKSKMKCFLFKQFSYLNQEDNLHCHFKTCSIFSIFLHLIITISVIFIGFVKSREKTHFSFTISAKSYDIIPYLFLSNNQFNQKWIKQFKSSKITLKQIWLNYSSYHFLREVSNEILQLTYFLK